MELEGELTALGERKASLETTREGARKDLIAAREAMAELRVVMSRVSADAVQLQDPYNPDFQGDFSVLSRPVMPEVRIAPPRTVLAVAFGIGVGFVLLIFFMAEWFVISAVLRRD